jgi:hypothetical protein
VLTAVALAALAFAALRLWQWSDSRHANRAWEQLARTVPTAAAEQDLPEPARRFFLFGIKPGTPLWPVTQIRMSREIARAAVTHNGSQAETPSAHTTTSHSTKHMSKNCASWVIRRRNIATRGTDHHRRGTQ